jgi:hypothetical protein
VGHAPGDTVDLAVFRCGKLIHRPVTVAAALPNE